MIDLRTLRPLDDANESIASVTRTRRAVIVDEGWRSGSMSAEIGVRIMEHAFYELDAPVARVCTAKCRFPIRDTSKKPRSAAATTHNGQRGRGRTRMSDRG